VQGQGDYSAAGKLRGSTRVRQEPGSFEAFQDRVDSGFIYHWLKSIVIPPMAAEDKDLQLQCSPDSLWEENSKPEATLSSLYMFKLEPLDE
jgi:hypothetical protein